MTHLLKSLRSKFPDMGTNIFTAMNAVAAEYGAINLAQGFPNFDCPPELIAYIGEAFAGGKNQYAPMPGLPELREAIAEKVESLYGRAYHPGEEITVTPGGHSALMSAATSVLHPGDEAILFDPSFDCFAPIVALSGAVPIRIKLKLPDYTVDWDEVRDRISPRTRLIWINTPHNPTGGALTATDIQALVSITSDTDIVILSDEVYEHIVFDGELHQSVCRHAALADRSFAVYSFGKVFHATGWKVGYCLAPQALMREFRKIHQMTTFTTNHPVQCGLARFLKQRDHYLSLPAFYQRKRDILLERLKGSRFSIIPSRGSYFQCINYGQIADVPEMEMAVRIAQDARVATIPLSPFYEDGTDNRTLRLCFAKTDDVLEKAAEALCKI